MKEDMYAWYQGLNYKEGFVHGEVSPSREKKKLVDTYTYISVPGQTERQKLFGDDGDSGRDNAFFLTSVTCIVQIT